MVIVSADIRAFQKGEYNPVAFRLRQGYERKFTSIIAYLGMLMPFYFIKSNISVYVYFLWVLWITFLTKAILNLKSYHRIKRRRILFDTVIIALFYMLITIFAYKILFI